jgi:mitotic spindle assembly checkpoint protein MAD2
MSTTLTSSKLTLRGSTAIVTEFFGYAVNSVLYQRGIYPPETFSRVNKYGITMLVTQDQGLSRYLGQVLSQLSEWLMQKTVQKLVIAVSSTITGAVVERWVFDVECDKVVTEKDGGSTKSEKEIMGEIQSIIRQITASVSFLPLLSDPCSFDLLVYTDADLAVPVAWEESDPKYISNSAEVRLRSFNTGIHQVDTMVSYAQNDD